VARERSGTSGKLGSNKEKKEGRGVTKAHSRGVVDFDTQRQAQEGKRTTRRVLEKMGWRNKEAGEDSDMKAGSRP